MPPKPEPDPEQQGEQPTPEDHVQAEKDPIAASPDVDAAAGDASDEPAGPATPPNPADRVGQQPATVEPGTPLVGASELGQSPAPATISQPSPGVSRGGVGDGRTDLARPFDEQPGPDPEQQAAIDEGRDWQAQRDAALEASITGRVSADETPAETATPVDTGEQQA